MLRPTFRFDELNAPRTFAREAVERFLHSLEKALGMEFVIDAHKVPFHKPELVDLFAIADSLKKAGVMGSVSPTHHAFADEPRLFAWVASYAHGEMAGGASLTSDRHALVTTLAECLERHLWQFETDYFVQPNDATDAEMRGRGIALARFAGITDAQREKYSELRIEPSSKFRWIRGHSLVSHSNIHIPAQIITGIRPARWGLDEPLIRPQITTGLATHPDRTQALLSGVLEVLERDAYMIMWLNQLSLPRIDLDDLATRNEQLHKMLEKIKQYRITVDVMRLITDAPTHAVCAVIRDELADGVPIMLGMGVGADCGAAVEHALREGLRMRWNARGPWRRNIDAANIVPSEIQHREHAMYWLHDDRYKRLDFMTAGPVQKHTDAEWENDTPQQHLDRIVEWCRTKGYECASVSLSGAKKNTTPWFVEMVVIPELQPLHLIERFPCIGGKRLSEIPQQFGYTPREPVFIDEPHPFV